MADALHAFDVECQSFADFEDDCYARHQQAAEAEIIDQLNAALSSVVLIDLLRRYAAQGGYHFDGYRKVKVRLRSGTRHTVSSPVFVKAKPKDKRRRQARRKNVTRHFALEYLGFWRKCSPVLIRNTVQMAALCPSFETAATTLTNLGTPIDKQLVRTPVLLGL